MDLAKPMITESFSRPPGKTWGFMVEYRHRYTDSIRKDESTKEIVRLVGRPHKVDLNNPDKIIIVEVFNKALGMSIVDGEQYRLYKGFNIRQVTEKMPRKTAEDDDRPPKQSRDAAADGALADVEKPEHFQKPKEGKGQNQGQQQRLTKQQRWAQEDQAAEEERKQSVALIPVKSVSDDGILELELEFAEPSSKKKKEKSRRDSDPMLYDLSAQKAVRLL